MKLFLSSMAISAEQAPAFSKLVGKEAEEITIALIENAADGETGDKGWVQQNYNDIKANGFKIKRIDLNDYLENNSGLLEALQACDAIWLGGGNSFYLRWILHKTKADDLVHRLVSEGKVYSGGSAGAIVAGPTLRHFEHAEDPSKAPQRITEGLKLTDIVIVPHWEHERYGSIVEKIRDKLTKDGFKTRALTDEQALIVNGHSQEII